MSIRSGRLVGSDDLRDRVLGYIRDRLADLTSRTFGRDGVFSQFTLASPGADMITVAGDGFATDGIGNILEPALCVDGAIEFMDNVGFENLNGVTYHVALKYAEIPSGAQQNSAGHAEFVGVREFIGESGNPDSVVDNGNGTITFVIDSLLESVKGTPRKAYVWLKVPQSSNSEHKELCTVVWGASNSITTTHTIGQTTVSTDVTKYTVLVPGPTIRKTFDPETAIGYVYIGWVRGAGAGNSPVDFDIQNQKLIDTNLSNFNEILDGYSNYENLSGDDAGTATALAGSARFRSGAVTFNGVIHVMGGDRTLPAGNMVAEHYSYNPATDTWTLKTAIPSQGGAPAERSGMGVIATTTKIYVIGGGDNSAAPSFAYNVVQCYDPNTNSWDALKASLPTAIRDMCIGKIGDYVYVAGGINNNATEIGDVSRYDIVNNSWSALTALPDTYSGSGSAVLNDQLYMVGGFKNAAASKGVLRFDPETASWLARADLPIALYETKCAVINGILYAMGGANGSGYATRTLYAYNSERNEWTDLGEMPMQPIRSHVFQEVDGIGFISGGVTTRVTVDSISDRSARVDLSHVHLAGKAGIVASTGRSYARVGSGTTAIASKPSAMRSAPSVTVDNRVYFVCGEDAAGAASAEFWCYHPETDTYERLTDCPNARKWGGAVYHPRENAIYAIGGQTGGFSMTSVECYDLTAKTWSSRASTIDRCGFGQAILVGDKIYLFGGGAGAVTTPSTGGQIYDIRTRAVTTPAVLPAARRWTVNFAVPKSTALGTEDSGAHIYVMGGDNAGNVLSTIYVYDTDTNLFSTSPVTLAATRGYAECVPILGTMKAAIIGGVSGGSNASTLITVFDFATMSATGITGLASARLWASAAHIGGLFYMFSGSSGSSGAPTGESSASFTYDASESRSVVSQIKNYSTGRKADVIGFGPGDIYGLHSWLLSESQEIVITGDQ